MNKPLHSNFRLGALELFRQIKHKDPSFYIDLMSAPNRNSLAEKLGSISKCDICFQQYNRREKQPVIICSMHHTVCRECMHDLEARRQCPFCRENINFGKIVVNNYIFQLLPTDNNPLPYQPPPPPNTRVPVYNPQQQQQPYNPPQQYPPVYNAPVSVNYQPQQPIYPQNYFPPPPEDPNIYYRHPEAHEIDDNIQDLPFDVSDCKGSIMERLRLNQQPDRMFLYVAVFMLQVPYLFFDFYFALSQKGNSECMDKPYVTKAYVVRPWLLAMGVTQATITGILLLGALLRICRAIDYSVLKKFQFLSIGILVVKILLWLYMEIALFASVIGPHCSGGVYAYGVIQTVIHGIFLLIICCMSTCR